MGGECSQKLSPGGECESSPGHDPLQPKSILYLRAMEDFPAAAARLLCCVKLIFFATSCFPTAVGVDGFR